MRRIPLKQVAKIDRSPASDTETSNLPYVGLEHIEKETGRLAASYDLKPANLKATKFRFTPNHVLYGKLRPYLNKVIVPDFDGVCTTELLPILPNETELDRTYLWAYLLSPSFVDWASQSVSGANLPRLSPRDLGNHAIPCPHLSEQKRIAAVINTADRLRRLRRYALELSEGFLQSVFLEMFGDPVTNPMGWAEEELGILLETIIDYRGKTPPKSSKGIPLLSAANIKRGRVDFSHAQFIRPDVYQEWTTRGFTQPGDVLITTEAPVGEVAAYPENGVFQISRRVMALRPNLKLVLSPYLLHVMLFPTWHKRLTSVTRGSTVPRVLKPDITTQPIPLPPLELQRRFGNSVRRFEQMRAQQHEAIRQVDHLFDTLLHSAFRGEL